MRRVTVPGTAILVYRGQQDSRMACEIAEAVE